MKNNRYAKLKNNARTILWLLVFLFSLLKLLGVEIPMAMVYAYGIIGVALIVIMFFAGRKAG